MPRRTRYQQGSVQREKRQSGADVWVFRWWESTFDGTSKRRKAIVGTVEAFPTEASALQAAKALRIDANQQTRISVAGQARLPNWSLITGSRSWLVKTKDASRSRRAPGTKAI